MINQAQFEAIKAIVIEAGSLLQQGWLSPTTIIHETKADGSLVSNYDRMSEELMLQKLPAIIPGIPLVSEEEDAAGIRKNVSSIYCTIDPLDGTRNYLSHRKDFATLLAIVENGKTIAAVTYLPMQNILISAHAQDFKIEQVLPDGTCADFTPPPRNEEKILRVAFNGRAAKDDAELRFLGKLRAMGYTIIHDNNPSQYIRLAQTSLGQLDFYFAQESQARSWDVAPFDLLLEARGGTLVRAEALDDAYGQFKTFIAARDKKLMDLLLAP